MAPSPTATIRRSRRYPGICSTGQRAGKRSADCDSRGYTFAGWSYDKDGNSKVLDTDFVSANTWVYAQWQEVTKFNVIANTNGGYFANGTTAGDAMVEAVEDGANLVDSLKGEEFPFVRPGYTFAGWSYDKDGNSKVLDTDFVSANTFVYAQWTKADDSKKDDSKPADTTKKNDTKGNTKKTVAQKIKRPFSATPALPLVALRCSP
ncbi:hypothetical protein DXA37_03650 [Bifidobacterium pseudocatenulatum]|nr:hypothetical protein DXA37_03650 [Bifidobacterium pseudocatenulatum]